MIDSPKLVLSVAGAFAWTLAACEPLPDAQTVDPAHRPGVNEAACNYTVRGTLDVSASYPGEGYYSATVANLPAASELLSGTNVLGVTGAAHVSSLAIAPISRSTAGGDLTYRDVHAAGSCDVPLSGKINRQTCEDANGVWTPSDLSATQYERATVSSSNWSTMSAVNRAGFVNCGSSGTIAARIADCATKNGANATWPTTTALEFPWGTWKLVARLAANAEVWRDEFTRMLWSSDVASANVTWCRYTGNQENAGGVDCSANTQSVCYEDGSLTSPVAGENFATGTYANAKGGMGRNSTTKVRWRAMTLHDWNSAFGRGLYYVLPTAANMWTSTLYPGLPGQAYFIVAGIYTNPGARTGSNRAFCIGR